MLQRFKIIIIIENNILFSRFGNILIGWCPGDIADLVETMTDDELSTAITDHLKMFFGKESSFITCECLLMCQLQDFKVFKSLKKMYW